MRRDLCDRQGASGRAWRARRAVGAWWHVRRDVGGAEGSRCGGLGHRARSTRQRGHRRTVGGESPTLGVRHRHKHRDPLSEPHKHIRTLALSHTCAHTRSHTLSLALVHTRTQVTDAMMPSSLAPTVLRQRRRHLPRRRAASACAYSGCWPTETACHTPPRRTQTAARSCARAGAP